MRLVDIPTFVSLFKLILNKMRLLNLKHFVFGLSISSLIVSCKKDEVKPTTNESYNIPSTYTFNDASSKSTVDFSGQKTRLVMLEQIGNLMGGLTPVTESSLLNMFDGTGFTVDSLNTSGKRLSDKTAASIDYFTGNLGEKNEILDAFKKQLKEAEVATNANVEASEGIAGYYMDGTKKRYFSANGLEPQQVFLKGMMGACLLDQTLNSYLSSTKLDGGSTKTDNTNRVLVSGKNYTDMEHFWDEAYGYIFGNDNLNVNPAVYKYWSSYINQVDVDPDFSTVKENIINAFIKGRAAITNKDYITRDAQIAIIKKEMSKVVAVRAVYYMNEGKGKLATDNGKAAFHALSEGYGFIWSLRFTQNPDTKLPYFSKEEVKSLLDRLMGGTNGLYAVDYLNSELDKIAQDIATRFGFTVAQAIDATK
jgi:hypothetical protein